ncbi:hypothetical protein [Bacillus smithii]|uniref:hypothetical protein n=1 Tax=Bacillus smithii TaxID=1479 RepID=UPI002E21A193|nr:hypothetical protein [Bacillus smithii]MED4928250.1 hypothetical protein [Bacillus smithii]
MGLAEVLTIIFVVLKLTGVISWNWFLVLLPEIIAIGIYVLWFLFLMVFINRKAGLFNWKRRK